MSTLRPDKIDAGTSIAVNGNEIFSDGSLSVGAISLATDTITGSGDLVLIASTTGGGDVILGALGGTIPLNEVGDETLDTTSFTAVSIIGALNEIAAGGVGGGGGETLAETLLLGNTTGGTAIEFTTAVGLTSSTNVELDITAGGLVDINAGQEVGGVGSAINISAGDGSSGSRVGGAISISAGDGGSTDGTGGAISILGGKGHASGITIGGGVTIRGGNSSGGTTYETGAEIILFPGYQHNGGTLFMRSGTGGNGSGRDSFDVIIDVGLAPSATTGEIKIGTAATPPEGGTAAGLASALTIGNTTASATFMGSTLGVESTGALSLGTNAGATTITIGGGAAQGVITIGKAGVANQINGWLNVGSTTDAVAAGDFAAGTTGDDRLFYDQSTGKLLLRKVIGGSATDALQVFNGSPATSGALGYVATFMSATNSDAIGPRGGIIFGQTYASASGDTGGGISGYKEVTGGIAGDISQGLAFFTRPTGGTASLRWRMLGDGHLIPHDDNTYDIGSSSFKVKDLHLGGAIVGGTLTPSFLNVGTVTGASANGDFYAGEGDAGNRIQYDASTGRLIVLNTNVSAIEAAQFYCANPVVSGDGLWSTLFIDSTVNDAVGSRQGICFGATDSSSGHYLGTIQGYRDTTHNGGDPIPSRDGGLEFTTLLNGALIARWRMHSDGHFIASTDNIYDIGASGATRPRTGYFGTSLEVGTTSGSSAAGDIQAGDGTREMTWDASANTLALDGAAAIISSDTSIKLDAPDVNIGNGAGSPTVDIGHTNSGNITINSGGTIVVGDGSAGQITLDSAQGISLDTTFIAANFSITANDGNPATLTLAATNAGGGTGNLDFNADDAITIDAASVSLDGTAASNFTVTGAVDLTLSSTAGSVVVSGGEAAADAVQITASNAAGGIDINAGTGGIKIAGGGGTTAMAVNIGTDSAAMTVTVGSTTTTSSTTINSGATADLTLGARGGTITLNETGDTALSGTFTATSLMGALNELKADVSGESGVSFSRLAAPTSIDGTISAETIVVPAGTDSLVVTKIILVRTTAADIITPETVSFGLDDTGLDNMVLSAPLIAFTSVDDVWQFNFSDKSQLITTSDLYISVTAASGGTALTADFDVYVYGTVVA